MNETTVCFIDVNTEWDKAISNHKFDIYHLSGWVNSSTLIDEGTGMLLLHMVMVVQ